MVAQLEPLKLDIRNRRPQSRIFTLLTNPTTLGVVLAPRDKLDTFNHLGQR